MKRFPLLIFVAIATSVCVAGASVKTDLQGIRSEIRKKESLLKKTVKIEKKVSGEIVQIDSTLKAKENDLRNLKSELEGVEKGLQKTTVEAEAAGKEVAAKQAEIRKRLISLYKGGAGGPLRVVFTSESFPQMAENLRYMGEVVRNDRKIVDDYRERIGKLSVLKEKLETDAQRKERLKASVELKKQEIEAEKKKKVSYLNEVREDRKQYEASLKELQANARRLQAMVERLEAISRRGYTQKPEKQPRQKGAPVEPAPYQGKGLTAGKGGLAVPVRGEVIGRFGKHKHPQFNSYTVSNGITIAAPSGTDIRAVADGKVVFSNYFKGYGNMVIVDHGNGYLSLYAHASRIFKREGTAVSRNDVIAAVGDVDSPKGSVLYFELRHQGKPVDPGAWFR